MDNGLITQFFSRTSSEQRKRTGKAGQTSKRRIPIRGFGWEGQLRSFSIRPIAIAIAIGTGD